VSSFRGRAVQLASHDSMSLGRFRLCVLPSAFYSSLGVRVVPPTFQAAGRLRKGKSGLGFRVGNREECVLLSVCAPRRPGIRGRGRPLPSSRPLARSPCGHTTRSRLADVEGGRTPCVGFFRARRISIFRSKLNIFLPSNVALWSHESHWRQEWLNHGCGIYCIDRKS